MSTEFTATIEIEVEVDLESLGFTPDDVRQDMGKEPWESVSYDELEKFVQNYWSPEDCIDSGCIQNATFKKVVWQ